MDLERLQGDLRRLTEIVGGWDASKEIDALERDLVLEKLRGLYEAVRFGMPVAAPAEPAVGEASAPIDLGEVLSLDPLSDLPAPDAEALPEVQPPFEEVLSTVHRLNREKGITVVLITHHMNEAEEADRVIVMNDGRVAMDGTPQAVFSQVERLRDMGLTVPDTVDLLDRLRRDGVDVPLDALTVETCADAICAALG